MRRILVIDEMVPDPMFGAGYPRAFEIVRSLVHGGYQVDHFPLTATPTELARIALMFAGAVRFHPAEGVRGLRRLLAREGHEFAAIIVSRPKPMRTFNDLHWRLRGHIGSPSVIYDAEAVLAPREQRRRLLYGLPWAEDDYRAALTAELDLARGADAITTVGPNDAAIIRAALDAPVFVLPHSVTVRIDAPEKAGRRDILFVGRLAGAARDSPNVDSVLWFASEVMPILDRHLGSAYRVRLVGWLESPEVEALASDRILVHGVAEDLRPWYDSSRLFIAPTRFAAGIPIKVTEAMSEGIPCVVTPLLAEQLQSEAGEVAIGDDAEGFARECARLYTDDAAWTSIRDGGFAYVARACSPSAFEESLARALGSVDQDRALRSTAVSTDRQGIR